MRYVLAALIVVLLFSGCGYRGPLTLPPPAKSSAAPPSPSTANHNSAASQ